MPFVLFLEELSTLLDEAGPAAGLRDLDQALEASDAPRVLEQLTLQRSVRELVSMSLLELGEALLAALLAVGAGLLEGLLQLLVPLCDPLGGQARTRPLAVRVEELLARLFDIVVQRPSGLAGATVALTLYTFPYLFLNARSALLGLDASLEESARSLGLGAGGTFRRVVLPQLWPGLLAGWLVIALYVIGDFGVVSLMRLDTFSLAIYTQYTAAFNRGFASWLALILMGMTAVLVVLEWRLLGGKRYARTGSGVVRPGPRLPLGRYAVPAYTFVAVVLGAAILLPVVTLAGWLVLAPPTGALLASAAATFVRTAALAVPAALVAVLFALPVAVVSARGAQGAGRVLERIVYLGYAMPPLALALAVVMFALRYTPFAYQTSPLLVAAYVVSFLALAIGPIRSGLLQVSPRLEEAARSLGRRRSTAFVTTTLPLIGRNLLAAGALVLMVTMKELPLTYLLAPTGYTTLATRVFGYTSEGMMANAAPFAATIVLFSSLFVGLLLAYEGRRRS